MIEDDSHGNGLGWFVAFVTGAAFWAAVIYVFRTF